MKASNPNPGDFPVCLQCGACCRHNPGWFAPNEIELAAESLSMSTGDFSGKYLIIDHIEIPGYGKIEVFAPLRLNKFNEPALPPLSRVDSIYRYFGGKCIFFQNDHCIIYPYHPLECKSYFCSQINDGLHDIYLTHEEIALSWYNSSKL